MDEFIDYSHLASIDYEIKQGIQHYIKYINQINTPINDKFTTGPMKLNPLRRQKSSPRLIPLTIHTGNHTYFDLNQSGLWSRSVYCKFFPSLMSFIETLPFKKTTRIMLIFDRDHNGVPPHRDHSDLQIGHQFIWFRSNFDKKFFVFCPKTNVKKYIESYSAWFDTVNQYHGETPSNELTFSIRVDGVFNDALLAKIPTPPCNPASTAAYWSSQGITPDLMA